MTTPTRLQQEIAERIGDPQWYESLAVPELLHCTPWQEINAVIRGVIADPPALDEAPAGALGRLEVSGQRVGLRHPMSRGMNATYTSWAFEQLG